MATLLFYNLTVAQTDNKLDFVLNSDYTYLSNNHDFVRSYESYYKTQPLTNTNNNYNITTIYPTVISFSNIEIDSVICETDLPFTWNGEIFTQSGSKSHTFISNNGSDSIITMNVIVAPIPEITITGVLAICDNSLTILTASGGSKFLWSTGDTTKTITISSPGLYTVTVTDTNGCSNTAQQNINNIVINPIIKTNINNMCAGETNLFTVGKDTTSSIVIGSNKTTLSRSETIFLPDGIYCPPLGCSYRSPLTFDAFEEGAVVESINDILYVRLNIEHSYAGDLYINITCPNGQKADILKYSDVTSNQSSYCNESIPSSSKGWSSGNNSGYGTFFGYANDNESPHSLCNINAAGNEPGTGWNYCWSNNTSENYQYAEGNGSLIYRIENRTQLYLTYIPYFPFNPTYRYAFDSSNVATGTQFYHPDESFESLIGCPLNGDWYIEVIDGWQEDNGYIFGWELALAPHLVPSNFSDVTNVTVEGPWITAISDTTFAIHSPDNLKNDTIIDYMFHFFDEYGCSYDSTISINFFSTDSLYIQLSGCDSVVWNNNAYNSSGIYKHILSNDNNCDSLICLDIVIKNSANSSDSIFLVENQLPYHFTPHDTIFTTISPNIFYFNYTLQTSNGCDSTINQKVVVFQNTYQSFDTIVCENNFPFFWLDREFTHKGTFVDSTLNSNGSTNYRTFTISIDTLKIVSNNISHVMCYGDDTGSASVIASGGIYPYQYHWTDSQGLTISDFSHIDNLSAGIYNIMVTDSYGCFDTATITINTLNPEANAGNIWGSQDICINDELQPIVGNDAIGNGIYLWQISHNLTTWTQAPGINNLKDYTYPENLISGSYWFRREWITPNCGSLYSDTVSITISAPKNDTIYGDVCLNSSYQENEFNILAQETQTPGTLQFTRIIETENCDSIVTLFLNVNPSHSEIINDEICEGDGYYKNGFSIPKFQTKDITFLEKTLNLTSAHGCDSTIFLNLTIIDTSTKIINLTDNFCEQLSAELLVETNMKNFLWSTNATTQNITVRHPGSYSVVVSDGNCSVSRSITIEKCEWNLFLPNAITPSQQNLNDYFFIPANIQDEISSLEVYIFNKWGEVVFHSNDKNFRWNGHVNGKITIDTIYLYMIKYRDLSGKPGTIRGTITVL